MEILGSQGQVSIPPVHPLPPDRSQGDPKALSINKKDLSLESSSTATRPKASAPISMKVWLPLITESEKPARGRPGAQPGQLCWCRAFLSRCSHGAKETTPTESHIPGVTYLTGISDAKGTRGPSSTRKGLPKGYMGGSHVSPRPRDIQGAPPTPDNTLAVWM